MNEAQERASEARATIADLELYGLSHIVVNAIEVHFGYLYVDELRFLTAEMLASDCRNFGPARLRELQRALRAFLAEHQVRVCDRSALA